MTDQQRSAGGRLRPVLVGLVVAGVVAVGLGLAATGAGQAPGTAVPSPPAPEAGDVRVLTRGDATPVGRALSFVATGLAGGGFQNVVAFRPDGDVVLVGGDNGGIHRSTDAGTTWVPVAAGLPDWAAKVAAIAWHPTDPDVVVAGGGFAGRTGGLLRSEDAGASWEVASRDVRFSGANTPDMDPLPRTHPRATGDLLVWIGDVLVAADFDAGVHRSTDGGRTWELLGVDGPFLRGLAVDDGGDLLVATRGEGLWRVTDPTGAATVDRVDGGPDAIEEVAVADDVVVVAADGDGVWTLVDGRWQQSLAVDGVASTVEVGLDGTWWAGTHRQQGDTGGLLRSTDGGATWEDVGTEDTLEPVVAGTQLRWWVADAQASFLPDGSGWTAAQVAVDPADPTRVLVAGRAGVWRTEDGGGTWQAAVAGLGVTAHDQTAVAGRRIATANTDHRLLVSDDGLRTVTAVEPGASKGTAVAVDRTGPDGTVLVSTAERDANTDGELYRVAADRFDVEPLGLGDAVDGRRAVALASGYDRDVAVVLAAVEGAGIWRLREDVWSRAPTEAFRDDLASPDGQLVWPEGGPDVWAYDRATGVWRSGDAGTTWELVLGRPVESDRTDPVGFLDVDADGAAWVATAGELLRLADGEVDVVAGVDRPGPVLVLPDGGVLVAQRDAAGEPPGLLLVCGGVAEQVLVDDRFRGGASDVVDLDLDADGHLVVTMTTNGLLRSASPVATALACGVTAAS